MKKLLPFISILLFSILFSIQYIYAQDTLYKEDGSRQIIRIIDISGRQLRYRLASDTGKATYVIHKNAVNKIIYEKGMIETFQKDPSQTIKSPDLRQTDFGRHFIAIAVTDLLASILTINYEYTFKSGYFSLRFPTSLALSQKQNNYFFHLYGNESRKIFSQGINLNIYPWGQGTVKYYWGPAIEIGKFEYNLYSRPTTNWENEGTLYGLFIESGVLFQPGKHINISVFLSGGGNILSLLNYRNYYGNGYDRSTQLEFAYRLGVNFGFKF